MRISRNRIDLEGARLDNAVITNSTLSGTTAATQAEQETGTSTTVAVTPGRQHFHPGHPKCWAVITVAAGVPTLQTSYNITSITDTAVGALTITIATDFSSGYWSCVATATDSSEVVRRTIHRVDNVAGSVLLRCFRTDSTLNDPDGWNFVGFGDQA